MSERLHAWPFLLLCLLVLGQGPGAGHAWAESLPLLADEKPAPPQPAARPLQFYDWLSLTANTDLSFRTTQFFERNHDVTFLQAEVRVEGWLPPFRNEFSYGPYLRGAVVVGSRDEAFENGWLAGPGVGFQLYPFSFPALRQPGSTLGAILGPMRLFVEYNRLDYWGNENRWRPDEQTRFG